MVSDVQQMLKPNKFLFVCAENVCRSPAMEAILKHIFQQKKISVEVESCGIYDHYLGENPDRIMQKLLKEHGIIMVNKAKLFDKSHFDEFDLILCATNSILKFLKGQVQKKEHINKILLATQFSSLYHCQDVPDPPGDSKEEYQKSWEIMHEACQSLVKNFYQ